MPAFIDITGQRFGRLVVLGIAGRVMASGKPSILWKCLCDCGNERQIRVADLRRGHMVSCGCAKTESFVARNTKHGDAGRGRDARTYRIWHAMRQRCRNPNAANYLDYGGRGITVCDEWFDSYDAFREWALANGYEDGLCIDRIDNDNGYRPDNCRWVTYSENLRNRRKRGTGFKAIAKKQGRA